eukprot:15453209-Alexandrium_andersonii.AAC.2
MGARTGTREHGGMLRHSYTSEHTHAQSCTPDTSTHVQAWPAATRVLPCATPAPTIRRGKRYEDMAASEAVEFLIGGLAAEGLHVSTAVRFAQALERLDLSVPFAIPARDVTAKIAVKARRALFAVALDTCGACVLAN